MFRVLAVFALFALASASVLKSSNRFFKVNEGNLRIGPSKSINAEPFIANGNRANVGDFPWHASLFITYHSDAPNAEPSHCSGAILNEKWVLTPAECIFNSRTIRVDVGSVDINKPLISVFPDSFTLHPQYDQNKFKNNIALLRLPSNSLLDFTSEQTKGKIAPIRLPRKSQIDSDFVDAESYYSSFGYPSPNHKNLSEYLLYSEQRIIPNTACVGFYGNDAELISKDVICSLSVDMRQAACKGDAGGPLYVNEYGTGTLVGILSFIHKEGGCGRLTLPTVFTRITSHFEWIRAISGYTFRP